MADTAFISQDDDGIRLDRWFKRHVPTLTHGMLEKLLRTGQIRLDGKRVKSSDRLSLGQTLRLPPQLTGARAQPSHTPRAEKPIDIDRIQKMVIYQDEQVIVLNKPSGLATQGGSGLKEHVDGMLDALMFGKKQRPRLVHRLDRDTSGVLVIARTVPAAAALGEALRQRDASKIYWALTKGVPEEKQGSIKLALAKEGGHGKYGRDERMVAAEDDNEDAKHAITDYAVIDHAGDELAWVAAKPVTGRTHQIRVHLAELGTPIIGDFKYGGTNARPRGDIEDRLHLHARSIDIAHPAGGRLTVTAPLPPHMLKTWKLLGFNPNANENPFASAKKS